MTSAKKTIQQKMNDLDAIVEWFQADDFELEKAKEQLEKATTLAQEIEHDLTSLTNEITVLKQSFEESHAEE